MMPHLRPPFAVVAGTRLLPPGGTARSTILVRAHRRAGGSVALGGAS